MELNIKKIEECVKKYVTEMSDSTEQYNDYGYEYTEAITDIAYLAGYTISDLMEDDSELLQTIDEMLFEMSVSMNKYYLFND